MVPELKQYDLFDALFQTTRSALRTDIYEIGDQYRLEVELPGYKKEDIRVSLENGTLKIEASRNQTSTQSDENGKLIRSERASGQVERTFYIGHLYDEQDIRASFENGELIISMPTKEKKIEETTQRIDIR